MACLVPAISFTSNRVLGKTRNSPSHAAFAFSHSLRFDILGRFLLPSLQKNKNKCCNRQVKLICVCVDREDKQPESEMRHWFRFFLLLLGIRSNASPKYSFFWNYDSDSMTLNCCESTISERKCIVMMRKILYQERWLTHDFTLWWISISLCLSRQ